MSWSRSAVVGLVSSSSLLWSATARAQDGGHAEVFLFNLVVGAAVVLGVCGLLATFAFYRADRPTGETKGSGEPKWSVAFGCVMGLGVLVSPFVGLFLAIVMFWALPPSIDDLRLWLVLAAPFLTLGAWLWFGVRKLPKGSGEPKWSVAFGCGMGLGVLVLPFAGFFLAIVMAMVTPLHSSIDYLGLWLVVAAPFLALGAWLWFGVRMLRQSRPTPVRQAPRSKLAEGWVEWSDDHSEGES